MKPILKLLTIVLAAAFGLSSCKKSSGEKEVSPAYECASCQTTPEAIAENDASSKGVYKGIVIGSTGTVEFNILNGGSTITAKMVLDGTTVNLTSQVSWEDGEPYVADFTGTMNGQPVSISFSVGVSGAEPTVTAANIPGHPTAAFTVVKETSNSLIECFEGTYHSTRPEDGTFNVILSRSAGLWGGAARKNGDTENDDIGGTITSDGKIVDSESGVALGSLSGDEINGTFVDDGGRTVTIHGQRTL